MTSTYDGTTFFLNGDWDLEANGFLNNDSEITSLFAKLRGGSSVARVFNFQFLRGTLGTF
jgi:hypothetical protein